jgi:3-phenylpropionate/cinnamic acid dioxygenase small subunit
MPSPIGQHGSGDVAMTKNEARGLALVAPELQQEIEQFLYHEAELLDERRYREWYDLMADVIRYWAPTRYNRTMRELDQENSGPDMIANFDDDKQSLGWRVTQYESGMHWAEDPPSRTRHIVSNVRIRPGDREDEYSVRSNFLCYRNRLETEVDIWAGQREDRIRRVGTAAFQVAERTILLDQSVILSKNMSVLF